MPKFRYQAKDREGKSIQGILDMPDEKTAILNLRNQELIVVSVKQEKEKGAAGKGRRGCKIKLEEMVLFTRQLATMIDSGIPLVQALEIMVDQTDNKGFKNVVAQVKNDIATGCGFNEALAKHPKTFSALYINMVKAGEQSGALDDILERLALYLEKTDSLLRKVRSAMVYPSVVVTMAVAITLVLMLKVVPVFKEMFKDFGAELPVPTQVLIAISDFLLKTWYLAGGCIFVLAILFQRFVATEKGTLWFDGFKLKMPVFGVIMRKVAVSKFTRTLATLVKSGVPILGALEIVGKTAGNKVLEMATDNVRKSIREGENIATPLMRSKVFPPLVVRMIAVGEQTGELEKMLTKIADFYDDQVDAAVAGLTSIIEPLIIAFLGVVIGGVVICMFMPIFKLSSVVQNA